MARTRKQPAQTRQSGIRAPLRTATVVHDGSAFRLAAELRRRGYEVAEGPLLGHLPGYEEPHHLAVLATRARSARGERMREWARQLCWKGAPVLAVGDAMSPVAELFGTIPKEERLAPAHGRLADVHSASEGLFAGLPSQFRLALPRGERFDRSELSAEFSTTAWSRDGELIGASHVFRPVHLLHPAALDNDETRPIVLENLTRMLRENGGRAF